ncbi:hypothetical protein GCM10028813_52830 [Ramlibacter alkalitolerans]
MLGSVFNHSRTRAARSPEVGAEKAPPVSASSAWVSWVFKLLTMVLFDGKESPRKGGTGRILAAKRAKACVAHCRKAGAPKWKARPGA